MFNSENLKAVSRVANNGAGELFLGPPRPRDTLSSSWVTWGVLKRELGSERRGSARIVDHPEVIIAKSAPSHYRRLPWGCGHALRTALTVLRVLSSPRIAQSQRYDTVHPSLLCSSSNWQHLCKYIRDRFFRLAC